jgi:hypothetical protein
MTFTAFSHQSQRGHRVGWESDIEDRDFARTEADLGALESPEPDKPSLLHSKAWSRLQMLLDPLHFGA